ncbi:MAG: hypothetical protein JWQ23_1769 [Herminiimonas sp.]|nr:hypothetical protein [Herminiimonas sp.]
MICRDTLAHPDMVACAPGLLYWLQALEFQCLCKGILRIPLRQRSIKITENFRSDYLRKTRLPGKLCKYAAIF